MKRCATLLVTVAFFLPAFARNAAAQVNEKKQVSVAKAPASRSTLLYTGKPLTAQERILQLAAMAGKKPQNVTVAPVVTLTPSQMYINGFVTTQASGANVSFSSSGISIVVPYNGPQLSFNISTQPNTAYSLVFSVTDHGPSGFTVASSEGNQQFNVPYGTVEFAYIFLSDNSGSTTVSVSSGNTYWTFDSCEITSTPVN